MIDFVTALTGYPMLGCYIEPQDARALSSVYASDEMTVDPENHRIKPAAITAGRRQRQ
jgi:hypothetical protein